MGMIIPSLVMIFFDAIQACFPPFIPSPPLPAPTITVETANPNEPLTKTPCKFNWDQVQGTGCLVGCVRYSVMLKQRETIVHKLTTKENTATIPLPSMTPPTLHTFEVQAVAWFGNGITEVGKLSVTIGATTPASDSPIPGQNPTQQNGQPPGQQTVGNPAVPPINPQGPQFGQQHPLGPPPLSGPPPLASQPPQPPGSSGPGWTASASIAKNPKIKSSPKRLVPYPQECTVSTDRSAKKILYKFKEKGDYKVVVYKDDDPEPSVEILKVEKTNGLTYGKNFEETEDAVYRINVFDSEGMEESSDRSEVIIRVKATASKTAPECQWNYEEKKANGLSTVTTSMASCSVEGGVVPITWKVKEGFAYAVRYRVDQQDWKEVPAIPVVPGTKFSLSPFSLPKPATLKYDHTPEDGSTKIQIAVVDKIHTEKFLSDWVSVSKLLSVTDGGTKCEWK